MPQDKALPDGIFRRKPGGNLHIRWKDEFGRDCKMSTKGKEITIARALLSKKKEEARLRSLDLRLSAREEERQRLTVSDLIERYRPIFEAKKSARDEKRFAKFWKRVLGSTRARDVVPGDIEQLRRDKHRTGLAGATVNRYTAFLKRIFNLAIQDYLLDSNPVGSGRVKPFGENGSRDRVILPEEERLICAQLDPLYRAGFLISLYSGLRMGELITLTRADVDLRRNLFLLGETKAGKVQTATISPVAREAALYAMAAHKEDFLMKSPSVAGTHISERSLHDRLIKAVAAAGIEVKPAREGGITWHATRHTFVTRLTENGTNIGTVKELARHSTITMTNEYLHVASDVNHQALRDLCRGVNVTELFPKPDSRGGHLKEVL